VSEQLVLKAALGKHDHVKLLKCGAVSSPRIKFEFVEYDPLPKAFRAVVRGADIDVSEMALTTHLLALEFGKPLTALAVPLWRRQHHSNLVCLAESPLKGPRDLEGKKVGVRAYSQTTGVWIRGILKSQYGVDLDKITWVTMEDAHVAEYRDPPGAIRHTGSESLRDLLFSGELDAIMGERDVDPARVRPVIPGAEAEAQAWTARTGIFPVNHVVSVRNDLLVEHDWLAGELLRVFDEARAASGAAGVAAMPYGLGATRAPMQLLCRFAAEQKLTAREYIIDEVFPHG
jgi:4,5-dihydroxyphthalate decarboxylase